MTARVLDASVIVKLFVDEPLSDNAARAVGPTPVFTPDWALIECTNALWKRHRRGHMTADEVLARVSALRSFDFDYVVSAPLMKATATIACSHGHSPYDCLYVATALLEDAELVTADARQFEVAQAVLGERAVWLGDV